ncbi:hypothetical protein F3Y22_tig00110933pilonHSYRG00130 [Hibiscus syriacus]|uniref:Uncharacterized protein n=1 Tax=Hibiscus syriacus TaxID=106335 RepID=A0A6A2ZC84_HIBSY|nr:uncharacterized protein LOC120147083 [Hibiscus syriacus]KAE8689584.1 hypothetical protein F3Y22_tig00110933pilonHSYRG00130 [Hibiscus syriacus]
MQQTEDSRQNFRDESNEETLSLSDLVMNNDYSNEFWNDNDFSKQAETGDLFEFFSEDFPASASIFPENNNENDRIIFCGKIISYKENENQPNVGSKPKRRKYKFEQENDEEKKDFSCRNAKKCCFFPWKISSPPSLFKSRTFTSSKSKKEPQTQRFNKAFSMPASVSKFHFPDRKVSTLATPVKSKWYLFGVGVGRFPMEIELKDMKMRQSRKYRPMKFPAPDDGGFGGGPSGNVRGEKGRRSGKACRRLLNVLGCKQPCYDH